MYASRRSTTAPPATLFEGIARYTGEGLNSRCRAEEKG
jgi:hypothetical protein